MITWVCKITWNIRSVMFLLQQGLWPPNLAKWLFSIRSFRGPQPLEGVVMWHQKKFSSSTTIPEAAKVSVIKLHDHSNKWLCEVTWHIKSIKSKLSQCLLSPNFSELWYITKSSQSQSLNHVVLWFWFSPMGFLGLEHKCLCLVEIQIVFLGYNVLWGLQCTCTVLHPFQ